MTEGFDLEGLLSQAQKMQEQLLEAQAVAQATIVEGESGGGVVKIRANGNLEFQDVTIAPEAIDPDDPQLLADLVLAALHDVTAQLQRMQQQTMGGFDPGSLDLGGLLGPGGGSDDLDDLDDLDDER